MFFTKCGTIPHDFCNLYFPRCREIELIPHINQFKFPKKAIWKNEKPIAHYKYDIQNTHVSKNYKNQFL